MDDAKENKILSIIIDELKRQFEGKYNSPYVDITDDLTDAILDGHFDLAAIAEGLAE